MNCNFSGGSGVSILVLSVFRFLVQFSGMSVYFRTVASVTKQIVLVLPPYSPFLRPTEELFSWRLTLFDHQPHDQISLLEIVNAECLDVHHLLTITRKHHACEKNLWSSAEHRVDKCGCTSMSVAIMYYM